MKQWTHQPMNPSINERGTQFFTEMNDIGPAARFGARAGSRSIAYTTTDHKWIMTPSALPSKGYRIPSTHQARSRRPGEKKRRHRRHRPLRPRTGRKRKKEQEHSLWLLVIRVWGESNRGAATDGMRAGLRRTIQRFFFKQFEKRLTLLDWKPTWDFTRRFESDTRRYCKKTICPL